MNTCKTCQRLLDQPQDSFSADCGGDCVLCMANSGDPDCQRFVRRQQTKHRKTLLHSVKAKDVYKLQSVFAKPNGDGTYSLPAWLCLLEASTHHHFNN
jgi:hypothetical protein